jgi:thiol-disulfide isomerase/thioredoxin
MKRLFLPACVSLLLVCTGHSAAPKVGEPVEIKFTSVDQKKVDLSELKGKVVLVDFWATWCGPCVAEVPNVKAAYDKLHAKGFEIVGISFDKDEAKLKAFTASHKMDWPQYFASSGNNEFGAKFDIHSIPTMWLIDKTGKLQDVNGRDNLEAKVEKLLKK